MLSCLLSFWQRMQRYLILVPLHPLTIFLIGSISGLVLYRLISSSFGISILVGVGLLLLSSILLYIHHYRTPIAKQLLIIISASALGFCWGAYRATDTIIPAHLVGQPLHIEGVILAIEPMDHRMMKEQLTIAIQQVSIVQDDEWLPTALKIKLYVAQPTKLQISDVVRIPNVKIKQPTNESIQSYLARSGIAATSFIPRPQIELCYRPQFSIQRSLHQWRARLHRQLSQKLSPEAFALFSALFLGNKNGVRTQIDQMGHLCQQWGISHYLARSGLHLVLFALMWLMLLRLVPLPLSCKAIILMLLNILYTLLTWPSLSFMRALLLSLCYGVCKICKTQPHLIYHLSLVCLLVLVVQPEHLFALDFQLSFLLTFALGWFNAASLRQSPSQQQGQGAT